MKLKDLKYLATQAYKEWSEDKASRLAAALAYYTVFSIPPLLIIAIAIAGYFFGTSRAQSEILAQVESLIGPTGRDAIAGILNNAGQPGRGLIAGLISVVTLFFGASGVFAQLQEAMNTIWDVRLDPELGVMATVKRRFVSFTMVLGIGFLLLMSLILSALLAILDEFLIELAQILFVGRIIDLLVSFGVTTLLFALIFKVVPDVEVEWRDVWVGAAVTALLFTLGKWGLSYYLESKAGDSAYGAAGSLIVLLLWVYYSAQILFFGAEFTQVYANAYGSRIVAAEDAIPLMEATRIQAGPPATERAARPKQPQPAPAAQRASAPPAVTGPERRLRERQGHASRSEWLAASRQIAATFHTYMIHVLAVPVAVWQLIRGKTGTV